VCVVIQFAILGLATGALYVLLALGLVIIYRGSLVVNFAHGAIGMVGTFVYWYLTRHGALPGVVAALLGVATSAALGLLVHVCVMHPLRRAAVLTRIIATLAVLIVLQEGMALIYKGPSVVVAAELPTKGIKLFGTTVGADRLIILGIVVGLAAVLGALYRFTQFGRLSAAATENPQALAGLGHSPSLVVGVNWCIGSALAGAAGILLAPIVNLSVTGYTLLVVPALAAAVAGRLMSLPLTLAGGLVIGVIQSEVSRYVTATGWTDAVPFLAMVLLLVIRGEKYASRTQFAVRLPRIGTGRIRPAVVVAAVGIAALLIETLPAAWDDALTTTLGTALIVLSVVVVTGYSGQLSLAQIGFAGWGTWIAAELAKSGHLPFLLAILVGALATLPLGLLVGAICLRSRGVNLAIATLGMAVALNSLVFSNAERVGYGGMIAIPATKVGGLDVNDILYPQRYALLTLIALAVVALGVANLRRGRSGRRFIAVRSNERAAASLGIGVRTAKLAAFGWSSVIAALGGALLAFRNPNIVFSAYDPLSSVNLVGNGVVGGVGWIGGAVAAGTLQLGSLGSKILDELGGSVSQYLPLIGGGLLLVVLLTQPDGVAAQMWDQLNFVRTQVMGRLPHVRRRAEKPADTGSPAAADLPAAHPVTPRSLALHGVSVSFGGVRALADVDLTVEPGEIVGLIGPNGAGKTTLIDAATGFVRSRGRVVIGGRDVTGRSASERARQGLTRSFQSLELFDDLTVLDNLRAASERRDLLAYLTDAVWPRRAALTPATTAAIRSFELEPYLDSPPSDLPYGVRRLVGIARSVATEASILALDEPAAGLAADEAGELAALLRHLARDWGMGILLVEHNVELVMALCDRIYALNFGEVIASGSPEQVRNDPAVIAAYLGVDEPGPRQPGAPAEKPTLV
jgi:sulfate-transporting ATPase